MCARIYIPDRNQNPAAKTSRTRWHFLRGFSARTLAEELAQVTNRPSTAPPAAPHATSSHGWLRHTSEAWVGREAPGPPGPHGAFARGRALLASYAFSDPEIVAGHFDPQAPLLGRPMVLELKACGFRYLCGVVVSDVRDERGKTETAFGYRYDTRAGHVEAGTEWFVLTKDHLTGDLCFRIEAIWRPGDFPNWWSEVGFGLVERRARQDWHRLAHLRMRHLLEAGDLLPVVSPSPREGRGHHDARVRRPPTRALARQRASALAHEAQSPAANAMPRRTRDMLRRWGLSVALGAVTGLRSMMGPALVSRWLRAHPTHPCWTRTATLMATPVLAHALSLLAWAELAMDKLPAAPSRMAPLPLAGRAAMGMLVGLVLGGRRSRARRVAAGAGAMSAVGAACLAHRVRALAAPRGKRTSFATALLEDVIAFGIGHAALRALR
ncbi:MAG: DUF1990 family protein [Myxococcales bacterium]|nr:DUF1990 family protein [Myxococcales bacterium]